MHCQRQIHDLKICWWLLGRVQPLGSIGGALAAYICSIEDHLWHTNVKSMNISGIATVDGPRILSLLHLLQL